MMLYGWRIAFLLGALTGVLGVMLRQRMPDPTVFLKRKHEIEEELGVAQESADIDTVPTKEVDNTTRSGLTSSSRDLKVCIAEGLPSKDGLPLNRTGMRFWPAFEILRHYWLPVLLQWTWEFWFAAAFYCYGTYMPSFLAANVPGMSRNLALGTTLAHLIGVMLIAWVTGWLCDKGMPRMIASGVVFIVAGGSLAPAAIGMRLGGVAAACLLHLWFLLMVGIIGGMLAVSMCPLYPPEVRTTGMNFAHQMAVGPIGGITPVILAAIKSINGDVFMTIVPWLGVCAGVSLISTIALYYLRPETNKDAKTSSTT